MPPELANRVRLILQLFIAEFPAEGHADRSARQRAEFRRQLGVDERQFRSRLAIEVDAHRRPGRFRIRRPAIEVVDRPGRRRNGRLRCRWDVEQIRWYRRA
jgi:hypothetical protein